MAERLYTEAEVAAIFELATKAQAGGRKHLATTDGMTLAGLQDIGREVGISPELVAQAARSLDRVGTEQARTLVGLPIGVGRSVDLGRKMSDGEWDELVVGLRDRFDATGHTKVEPGFRQWNNGNLSVSVESTPSGDRVRIKTYNSTSVGYLAAGVGMLAMAAFFTAAIAATGKDLAETPKMILPMFMAAAGTISIAWGALRLPRWVKLRQQQFKELADGLTAPAE